MGQCASSTAPMRAGPTTRSTRRCAPPPRSGASDVRSQMIRRGHRKTYMVSRNRYTTLHAEALITKPGTVRVRLWRLLASRHAVHQVLRMRRGFPRAAAPGLAQSRSACTNTFTNILQANELEKAGPREAWSRSARDLTTREARDDPVTRRGSQIGSNFVIDWPRGNGNGLSGRSTSTSHRTRHPAQFASL